MVKMRTPDDMTAALGEPFPATAHKTRSTSGKSLTYVEGHVVIHRLIDATQNQWDFRVISIDSREVQGRDKQGNPRTDLLMMATVELTIPGLGSRQHIGVQMVSPGSGEDLVKGAITDALKKAATLFGVGLELYGPDYEAGEVDDRRYQQTQQVPPRARTTSENTIPASNGSQAPDGWTQFWSEARRAGLGNWDDIEKALGVKRDQFRHGGEALDALHAKTQAATV